jgi:hypothetical protein
MPREVCSVFSTAKGAALGEAAGADAAGADTGAAGADVEGAEDAEDAADDPQAAASMNRPTAPTAPQTLRVISIVIAFSLRRSPALDHVVTVASVHAANAIAIPHLVSRYLAIWVQSQASDIGYR